MLDLVTCYWVLGVPHIVRYKLFNLVLPAGLKVVIVDIFDLVHEALHILDQDIVARDQDALLCATATRGCSSGLTARIRGGLSRGLSRQFRRSARSCRRTVLLHAGHGVCRGLTGVHALRRAGVRLLIGASRAALLHLLNRLLLLLLLERGLILLLLFVLFVSAERHVHLHFNFGARRRSDR